jgi:serine/threonine protein phosphatase PrpC
MRHVLTAAVGSLGQEVDPQVQRFKLQRGDQLLLCTDGLTETVDDSTIAHVLLDDKSTQRA